MRQLYLPIENITFLISFFSNEQDEKGYLIDLVTQLRSPSRKNSVWAPSDAVTSGIDEIKRMLDECIIPGLFISFFLIIIHSFFI